MRGRPLARRAWCIAGPHDASNRGDLQRFDPGRVGRQLRPRFLDLRAEAVEALSRLARIEPGEHLTLPHHCALVDKHVSHLGRDARDHIRARPIPPPPDTPAPWKTRPRTPWRRSPAEAAARIRAPAAARPASAARARHATPTSTATTPRATARRSNFGLNSRNFMASLPSPAGSRTCPKRGGASTTRRATRASTPLTGPGRHAGSVVAGLVALVRLLGRDAEVRDRSGLQTRQTDRLAGLLAVAVFRRWQCVPWVAACCCQLRGSASRGTQADQQRHPSWRWHGIAGSGFLPHRRGARGCPIGLISLSPGEGAEIAVAVVHEGRHNQKHADDDRPPAAGPVQPHAA